MDSIDHRDILAENDELRARLQSVLENSRDGISITDLSTGQFVVWSPVLLRITGFSRHEFQELSLSEFRERVHPQDLAAWVAQWDAIAAGKEVTTALDYRWKTKSGEYRWLNASRGAIRDEHSQPVAVVNIISDVTWRKEAELALRESEERYRTLFDTMTEGLSFDEIICDENGKPCDLRYLELNPAFERQTGLKAADTVGRTCLELFPEAEPSWFEVYGKVALTGEPARFEARFGPLGRTFDVSAFQTTPGRFAVIFIDVTDRKQAADALRQQASLLDLAHDAIIVRGTGDTITFWNHGAEETYGWTSEEALGRATHNLLRTCFPKPVAEINADVAKNGGWEGELVHTTKDDREIVVASRWAVTRDESGCQTGVLEINRDITDRKQAEAEILRTRAEVDRNAAQLESFFSNMTEGAILYDAEGNVVLSNGAAREILGSDPKTSVDERTEQYSDRNLDGRPMEPDETPAARGLRGETVQEMRMRLTRTDGMERVISASASPVFSASGSILGATTVFRDVTERAEAERKRQERFDREHRVAEMLQQVVLPTQVPSAACGFHFVAKYIPALEEAMVGGDFYDVFALGDGRVAVVIGDVAGKGLDAARQVSAARHAFRSYAYIDSSPSRVVGLVNAALCKDAGSGSRMLTAFFAVIDSNNSTVAYSSAGHEPPMVRRAEGSVFELNAGGMPLGILPELAFPEWSFRLGRGDALVLFTDGITEARSETFGMLGKSALMEFVAGLNASLSDLADGLVEKAKEYGDGRLTDDVAIVVVGHEAAPRQSEGSAAMPA